jgi:hypothetical protein
MLNSVITDARARHRSQTSAPVRAWSLRSEEEHCSERTNCRSREPIEEARCRDLVNANRQTEV